jgi:histone H3/H4
MATKKANTLFETTIETLDNGADAAKPKDGLGLIKDWLTIVNKEEAATHIADELQQLHDLLGEKEPELKKIATLVKKLGDETAKVAKKADEAYQNSLKDLSEALKDFAKELK